MRPQQTIWDSAVVGFGARRQKSDGVSYVVFYRTKEGRQRWHTIGRQGAPWTPDLARKEAVKILGRVAEGEDPAADKQSKRRAATVSELCDLYLADAKAGRVLTRFRRPKRNSTLALDRGRVERHIKPLIGKLKVATVTTTDIEFLLHDIAAGKTAATVATKPRGLARVRGGKATARPGLRKDTEDHEPCRHNRNAGTEANALERIPSERIYAFLKWRVRWTTMGAN